MRMKSVETGDHSASSATAGFSERKGRASLFDLALRAGGAMGGRGFPGALSEMKRAQWLPAEALQERAGARLASLLRHAAENVPFYREIYSRGGSPPFSSDAFADLRRLPVVTKATFKGRPLEDFLASNIPAHRRLEWTTSGSTGEPLKFHVDRETSPTVLASHFFYDSWFGITPFDRSVRFVAPLADALPAPKKIPLTAQARYEIFSWLQEKYSSWTQKRFSTFDVNEERAEEVHHGIEAFRPKYILGYTSTLAAVADALLRRNLRLRLPLRGVIATAETLTPERRQLMEQYFNAPIIDRYGHREFKFWCAQSCSESPDRFHVNTELVVWEIVREDGAPAAPGELGRVVLTNLHNQVMPFIRYDTGDLAVAGATCCKCGRGFPLVERLQGRSSECVRTPAGKIINPVSLGQYLFVSHDYVDAVRHYQLVVEAAGRMRLLVVPANVFDDHRRERLQKDLSLLLGEDVSVAVDVVGSIPVEKSGKRPIIKFLSAPQPEGETVWPRVT